MSDKETTPEQSEVVSICEGWFSEAKNALSAQRERWRKNEALYANEIESNMPFSSTRLRFNLPLAYIETALAIISDYLPTFDVMPQEENDIYYADMMMKRKKQLESTCELKTWIMQTIKDSKLRSNGITRIMPIFKKNQAGDMILDSLDISITDLFTWFPAPNSTGMDIRKNSRYQIFASPMLVSEIKATYNIEVASEGFLDEYRCFNTTNNGNTGKNNDGYALIKECYWMDEDRETYPNGRVLVWANGKVLADEPLWDGVNPADGGYCPSLPYFMITNYKVANKLFGTADTDLIGTLTKSMNEVISSLAEIIKKTSSPARKVMRSLWQKIEAAVRGANPITGKAGEEIVVDNMGDVSWEQPPQIQVAMFNFIDVMRNFIELILGTRDVVQGKNPSGVTAASGIIALQESAQNRIRYQIENEYSRYIREIGKYIVWIIQTYDMEIRTIREQNDVGEYEFSKHDPQNAYDNQGLREGEEGFNPDTAKMLSDSNFDIEVVAGQSLPTGRVATMQIATDLYDKGLNTYEDWLESSGLPNKKLRTKRHYAALGLEEMKAKQDAIGEAYPQFTQALQQAIADPETWTGSAEEEQLVMMVTDMPELLTTDEFKQAPPEIKERLLAGFMV